MRAPRTDLKHAIELMKKVEVALKKVLHPSDPMELYAIALYLGERIGAVASDEQNAVTGIEVMGSVMGAAALSKVASPHKPLDQRIYAINADDPHAAELAHMEVDATKH